MVDVQVSTVNMYGTKVEISLKKAEPGSWTKLEIPRVTDTKNHAVKEDKIKDLAPKVELIDLDDL